MPETPDLSTGSIAPSFSLPASNGTHISLADFHDKQNVYLFFVREYN